MRDRQQQNTPTDLGRLLTPAEVATRYFDGVVSARWVCKHVRPRVELTARSMRFYEKDVEAFLFSRRSA